MTPTCFTFNVKAEYLDEYKARHRAVWPDMRDALAQSGWRNYSLFLREDGLAIGYVESTDFATSLSAMEGFEVNSRWQSTMEPLVDLQGWQSGRSIAPRRATGLPSRLAVRRGPPRSSPVPFCKIPAALGRCASPPDDASTPNDVNVQCSMNRAALYDD